MRKQFIMLAAAATALFFSSCKNDNPFIPVDPDQELTDLPEWYYTGGKLGTTFFNTTNCFSQSTPAVDKAGLGADFTLGDQLAERAFNSNPSGTRSGLGPAYVRSSCQHCHPNYSHGTSIPEGQYSTNAIGNGTLLVVYNPETNAYVSWLAGMPQLHAVAPFKAPLDESKINVTWKQVTDKHNNQFADGETYELQYPVVTMPAEAVYVYNQGFTNLGNYDVLLENTIGIYGSGLLDAIPDADIQAQWDKEEADGYMHNGLNWAWFSNPYKNGNWYVNDNGDTIHNGDGVGYVRRFTYAMTRGPLQDGAGANAIWNIPNVTRRDRRNHYTDAAGTYALYSSKDKDVQAGFDAYISKITTKEEHPEWFTDDVEKNIYNYLTSYNLPVEMSDAEFTQMLIWHRGLAVPAARNVTNEQVLRGKEVFSQIGCDYCHRPSWTTGNDDIHDPNQFFTDPNNQLPRYPNQKIWPYTDMVQHKLHMENDIRTGWCRTTPLWGRGLHRKATGDASEARMHDTRARNVIEAIMWHGYSEESDAYSVTQKFYELPKEDRDAVVAFINAI